MLAGLPANVQQQALRRLRAIKGARIVYVYAPGCHACEAAKPIVRAFIKKYGDRYPVKGVDATAVDWKGNEPEGTPTFVLIRGDGKKVISLGAFPSLRDMELWLRESFK